MFPRGLFSFCTRVYLELVIGGGLIRHLADVNYTFNDYILLTLALFRAFKLGTGVRFLD